MAFVRAQASSGDTRSLIQQVANTISNDYPALEAQRIGFTVHVQRRGRPGITQIGFGWRLKRGVYTVVLPNGVDKEFSTSCDAIRHTVNYYLSL